VKACICSLFFSNLVHQEEHMGAVRKLVACSIRGEKASEHSPKGGAWSDLAKGYGADLGI
jgi:hypothetical protein